MKYPLILSFIVTLLISTAARSQQPSSAYDFQVLVQPGSIIGGHTFTPDTTIDAVALNDTGEMVFIARWSDPDRSEHAGIFTPWQVIASEGDVIDGRYIGLIPRNAQVAVNGAGQVAFEAWYGNSKDDAQPGRGHCGIFVGKHLAFTRTVSHTGSPFTLTSDGRVIVRDEPPGDSSAARAPSTPAPAAPKTPSLLGRMQIKPPKLPIPIPIAPGKEELPQPKASQQPRSPAMTPRPPMPCPAFPFRGLRTNGQCDMLIPINFYPNGFVLLLATPQAERLGTAPSPYDLESDPVFQVLSPEGQERVRQQVRESDRAIAASEPEGQP
jgi:hypothetical protein